MFCGTRETFMPTKSNKPRSFFFDGGTHFFQGFLQFADKYEIDSSWNCYSFEANPITYQLSQSRKPSGFNIDHRLQALLDKETLVEVHCAKEHGGDFTSQGSNVLEQVPGSDGPMGMRFDYDAERRLVQSIRFSDLLVNTVKPEDFVLVKLDIEGAEFAVLDDLIETGAISLINDLYVEFHERFFADAGFYAAKKLQYMQICTDAGINLQEWG